MVECKVYMQFLLKLVLAVRLENGPSKKYNNSMF